MFTRLSVTLAGVGCAAAAMAGGLAIGAHPAAGQVTRLAGSTAPFATADRANGDASASQVLNIQVWLAPDLPAAEQFAMAVSTTGNSQYRDFLTPDAYLARFGPSAAEASAVTSWLQSEGFTSVAADTGGEYVRASGTVAQVNATFDTTIKDYRASRRGSAPSYGNDSPLGVPSTLASDVIGVTGLNGTPVTEDGSVPGRDGGVPDQENPQAGCSAYYGQRTVSGLPKVLGTTTFPVDECGLTGAQLRIAYGENATNTGAGQTLAIVMAGGLEPQMFQTLKDFAGHNHLPPPSAARYEEVALPADGCTEHDNSRGEEQMDVEAEYAMAPAAKTIVVGGDVCEFTEDEYQAGYDGLLTVINGNGQAPLATIVSTSDAVAYDTEAQDLSTIQTAILIKAAAVGVGTYWSAGDQPCVAEPGDNPFTTDVGSTTVELARSGRRQVEMGSSIGESLLQHGHWGKAYYFGLGGGQSLLYRQPAYQRGVVPTSMSTPPRTGSPAGESGCTEKGAIAPPRSTSAMRSAPDVSAEGDPGMTVGLITFGRYTTIDDADTSLSSPLVAGMVAAAQQGQTRPFGFINPALYKLAGTSAFYDPTALTGHDPVSWRVEVCPAREPDCDKTVLWQSNGQNRTAKGYNGQVTVTGYDNTTGVGVPNGQAFIAAIRRLR